MSQEASPTSLYTKPAGKARLYLPTGQVAGEVIGDTLVKTVRSSKHMLIRPPAWACDIRVLRRASELGAKYILIRDKESTNEWRISMALFMSKGFELDRGHGRQLACELKYWTQTRSDIPVQLHISFA